MIRKLKQQFSWLGWPIFCGLLLAVIVQQIFPFITGSNEGWLSSLTYRVHPINKGPVSYYKAVQIGSPSVVHIFSTQVPMSYDTESSLARPFFQRGQKSLGSGVIVSKQGYILTNNHVVAGIQHLLISLKDGRQALAKIVGTDPETDLAVLKVNLSNLPVAHWINSKRDVHVGDVVLAIGNPFGLGQTVSEGIISATQRNLRLSTYENFIQTDAAINVGNSGGALVNTQGKLVGIATALVTSDGGNEGIGFAIPANLARFVLQSIVAHGKVIRGWLGVEAQTLTPELSAAYGLPVNTGILVSNIYPDSPAAKAGIKRGDVILHINKNKTNDGQSVMAYVATLTPGAKVTMLVLDKNKKSKVTMVVAERPEANPFQ